MKPFQPIMVLATAFLAVFAEAVLPVPRSLLGAQVDLLPALMIYAALNTSLASVTLLAIFGGIWFDTLSANPLGVSILPLMTVGYPVFLQREFILRDLSFAQVILGAAASALVPALTVLLLLTGGKMPLIGWGSLWQWIVMAAGGALATPLVFGFFDWCDNALGYKPRVEPSFRLDREIRRKKK